jgi:hypothetical protein
MMAFLYTTVTGSATVIGSQRMISFNLNTPTNPGTGSEAPGATGNQVTEIVTGLNYITGATATNSVATANNWKVAINTPSNGSATVTGHATGTFGELTVFGYGGG